MLSGKRSQFEAMVHAHSADLYRFAYWKCRDRVSAEDLVQETFARAWASWQTLKDEKAAKYWLFTILHREHLRSFERQRPEIAEADLDELMLAAEPKIQRTVELRQALWHLPRGYREALLLQVLGGFRCAEIAQMLGTSAASVMQRVSRARRALRKLLDADSGGMEQTR